AWRPSRGRRRAPSPTETLEPVHLPPEPPQPFVFANQHGAMTGRELARERRLARRDLPADEVEGRSLCHRWVRDEDSSSPAPAAPSAAPRRTGRWSPGERW